MDRLSRVQTPAATIDYVYDALGRRIQRSEGTDTVNYHYYRDTDLVDYRTDETGTLTAAALRGAGGLISETDYTTPSLQTSYYLYNPHGDTAAITHESGNVTATYRYDSFGNELTGSSLTYGYTGRWERRYDNTTQTIQMGARDYDPALGRFTSPDPLRGDSRDPQMRNRYPYALNNPATRYDLDGRMAEAAAIGTGIVITLPFSGPVIVVGSAAAVTAGVAYTGMPYQDELRFQSYEDNKCLMPPPGNHPDTYTHHTPAIPIKLQSWIDYSWNPDVVINNPDGSTTEIKYGRFPRFNGDKTRIRKKKSPSGETEEVWHEVYDRNGRLKHRDRKK